MNTSGSTKTVDKPFQARVVDWMMACFSMETCRNVDERNHRFLEESLELVQAKGCTAAEAHMLVDYVYGRPTGDPEQEVGGVMVTLAALCAAADMSMAQCGDTELARCWQNIERIRAKQAGKPRSSPLPGPSLPLEPAQKHVYNVVTYCCHSDLETYADDCGYVSWCKSCGSFQKEGGEWVQPTRSLEPEGQRSASDECCIDIFKDFTHAEAKKEPGSVYLAWQRGQLLMKQSETKAELCLATTVDGGKLTRCTSYPACICGRPEGQPENGGDSRG